MSYTDMHSETQQHTNTTPKRMWGPQTFNLRHDLSEPGFGRYDQRQTPHSM